VGSAAIRLTGLAGACLASLLFAGCSHSASPDRATVRVTERDFRISAPARVAAGDVRITVHNAGPDDHEFIVVQRHGGEPPLRGDGLTVDEDALQKSEVATVEPAPPGHTTTLRLHLRPGRYELLCNMSGHYLGGMHAHLTVR
jgi:uncharacterized cupredoxin-like copper-binding protein